MQYLIIKNRIDNIREDILKMVKFNKETNWLEFIDQK